MEQKIHTKQGKTIRLKDITVEKLDKLRHKGQSYDGIVIELIDYYEKKEGKSN